MLEEKKQEKLDKKDWYVFLHGIKFGGFTRKALRKDALAFGEFILGDDELSIGDFSLKFTDIIRFEIEKKYDIIIYCTNGRKYKIFRLPYIKMIANNVLAILSDRLIQYKNEKEKVPRSIVSPVGYETTGPPIQDTKTREGLLIFASYATKDADLYKIPELAHKLESHKEIGEVLYWQEDMHDSIIEYMNDNLGRCDVVLLFCSPNALDSVPVKKEWMAAESLNKPIIPVFVKPEHIPPLLNDRLGIEFDSFDFQKNIQEIYELILKKKEN